MQQPVDANPHGLPWLSWLPAWLRVHAGVTFVNAISNTVIWKVAEPIQLYPALLELSNRCGVRIDQLRLFNESGLVSYREDIVDPVISVVLLNQ